MVKIIFATKKYQAIKYILQIAGKILHLGIFPVAQTVKNLSAMQETPVRSLGQEDPLEKGMAIHSRNLAWRIP